MVKHQRDEKLIKAVGNRLRQLREGCGLSQEKVLFEKNIYLSGIENGHKNITTATLVELCDTYKITLRDFFKGLEYDRTGTA